MDLSDFSKINSPRPPLLGQLSVPLGGVHPVASDSGQLPAAVILIVDVVGDILQVLHVSADIKRTFING